MNYSEDELLPISALADTVFCERRAVSPSGSIRPGCGRDGKSRKQCK